jgi:hypothetical protein
MKKILFSLLFISSVALVEAQTVDEVVNKHIQAIGGAEAWKKVNSIKMEGTMTVQGAEVSVSRVVLHNKGSRQDINVAGMVGYDIYTPTQGWSLAPWSGVTSPEAKTAEDVAEAQEDLDAQGSLIDYAAKGHKVDYIGKDDVDGTECYKLVITPKGGAVSTYYIDTKTNYLIKSVAKRKANGQEMEIATAFSNYEKLPEGVVIAKSMTLPFGELSLTKISINEPVDESIFKN